MADLSFLPLILERWRPTRDTLHIYSQILGKVRRALTPPQRHWQHASLRPYASGLCTPPIPIPGWPGESFDLYLDLHEHRLTSSNSWGGRWEIAITGQPARDFLQDILAALAEWEIYPAIDRALFDDPGSRAYDRDSALIFTQALNGVAAVLHRFQSELPGETSPVQFWPHNFDLALTWFSGRKVPGVDPLDEENADERMGFGFSTGDSGVPEAYLYTTVYPWPDGLEEQPLADGASWHLQAWKGALMKYKTLAGSNGPSETLLNFLRSVYQSASAILVEI